VEGIEAMRNPDFKGLYFSAWKVPQAAPERPDETASLVTWLLHCPGVHAVWCYWMMQLIHLRPIEGVKPAGKKYPEAEHELLVLALNPEKGEPDPDNVRTFEWMTPPDSCIQFHGVTDDVAVEIVGLVARGVADGILCPDSDFRRQWERSFRSTLEHHTHGHDIADA
jgi:hypothetical protein